MNTKFFALLAVLSVAVAFQVNGVTPFCEGASVVIEKGEEPIFAAIGNVARQSTKAGKDTAYTALENLIKKGVKNMDAVNKRGGTPLSYAIRIGSEPRVVELLARSGGDVNMQNIDGNTPLHFAVIYAECYSREAAVAVVKALTKFGADKNIKNNKGFSPKDLASDRPLLLKAMGKSFSDCYKKRRTVC